MNAEKEIVKLIKKVNKSLSLYKKGGWIDCRRTPTSGTNIVNNLEEFIDARFNRECFDIPELSEICDLLDGRLFKCILEEPDENKKRYKQATLILVDESEINNPSQELKDLLKKTREIIGGNTIKFNSVKVKIKYTIEDE